VQPVSVPIPSSRQVVMNAQAGNSILENQSNLGQLNLGAALKPLA
jgi:hypothetical protein